MEYWLFEEGNDKALGKAEIMEECSLGFQREIKNEDLQR
jgi:hypothetical protein